MKYLFVLVLGLISSCENKKCESFNFKNIPYNLNYFYKELVYSNGEDTLFYYPKIESISNEEYLNPITNPTCNPHFTILYNSEVGFSNEIGFTFIFYPYLKKAELSIFSLEFNIKLKLKQISNTKKNQEIRFKINDRFEKIDSNNWVKYITIKKLRVSEIELLNGTKWKLMYVRKAKKNDRKS